MDRNPANDLKDTMWHFLMGGGQKENIPAKKLANIEIRLLDIVEGRFWNQDGNT